MKLAIIQCADGNYRIVYEGITTEQSALINFHNLCAALWGDAGTTEATVAIVDENLDIYHGYKEFISHNA